MGQRKIYEQKDVLSATFLSVAIPLANLIGVRWYFDWLHKGKSRQEIFRSLDATGTGVLMTLLWLVLTLVIVSQGHWGHYTVFIAWGLSFLLAPLCTWMSWMRIPLLEEVEKNTEYKKYIGTSHVFYYSMLEGGKETSFALVAVFYSYCKGIVPLSVFGAILGLAGILSLVVWKRSRLIDYAVLAIREPIN